MATFICFIFTEWTDRMAIAVLLFTGRQGVFLALMWYPQSSLALDFLSISELYKIAAQGQAQQAVW